MKKGIKRGFALWNIIHLSFQLLQNWVFILYTHHCEKKKNVNWKANAVFNQKQSLDTYACCEIFVKFQFFIVYCNAIFYQRDHSSFSCMSRENHLFKKVVLLPIRPCMSWQKISFLCAFKSLFGICKRIDKEKDAFSNSGTFKMPRTED